jgi:hypothetical protein
MRAWLLVSGAALLGACGNPYVDAAEERSRGGHCEETGRCHGIVQVDCGAAVDGPLYYFDEDSVEVISVCGGACFTNDPVQLELCRTMCPPPAWTCSD